MVENQMVRVYIKWEKLSVIKTKKYCKIDHLNT